MDAFGVILILLCANISVSQCNYCNLRYCIPAFDLLRILLKSSSCWCSWNQLGNMSSTEAMRLFVKILEVMQIKSFPSIFLWNGSWLLLFLFSFVVQEEDPGWYSRASNSVADPVIDVQMNVSIRKAMYILYTMLSPYLGLAFYPDGIHSFHLYFCQWPVMSFTRYIHLSISSELL